MLSKPSQAGRYYRPAWLPKKEVDANAEVITYTLTPDERAELDAKLLKKYGGEKVPRKPVVEISKEGLKALIDQGLKEKEIAAKLDCSVSTVKRLKAVKGLVGYKPVESVSKEAIKDALKPILKDCAAEMERRKKAVTPDQVQELEKALTGEPIPEPDTYTTTDGPKESYCPMCARHGIKSHFHEGQCVICGCDQGKPAEAENRHHKYPSSELEKAMTAVDRAQRTMHSYSAVDRAEVIAEILHGIADSLERTHGRRVEVDVVVLEVGE